ncbi:LysM peptidoglycan-binding domain-containing protein [Peribacillus butanolivorans]
MTNTVFALAVEYGSTIKQIKDWNKLDSKYSIGIGKKIRVK